MSSFQNVIKEEIKKCEERIENCNAVPDGNIWSTVKEVTAYKSALEFALESWEKDQIPITGADTIVGLDNPIQTGYADTWEQYEINKDDMLAIARVRKLLMNKKGGNFQRRQEALDELDELLSEI